MAERVVDNSETALGKKLFHMSQRDLERRSGHLGSTRSVFDREKFYKEFQCHHEHDGSATIRTRGRIVARIPPEHVSIYRDNPHINQVFVNGREFQQREQPLTEEDRFAPPTLEPRMAYARRQGEVKTVEHWGQRKLLMSEIEFLVKFCHLAKKVVYAGG